MKEEVEKAVGGSCGEGERSDRRWRKSARGTGEKAEGEPSCLGCQARGSSDPRTVS